MTDSLDLTGKVAIVTGGTAGVGRGITMRLLEVGAKVVICARHAPDELPKVGDKEAVYIAADVREVEQVKAVVQKAKSEFGCLDILVNNAGGSPEVDASMVSPKFSSSIINLNLIAPLNFCQKANEVMQHQENGGVIINIASVSGIRPSPGTAAYGAAKAGLINLTQSLAIEWAPKVRLNSITAGLIKTEKAHMHYGDEAGIQAVSKTVPLGRMATPKDIGDLCLFLASPLASYLTGSNIVAHGGGEFPAFLAAAKHK